VDGSPLVVPRPAARILVVDPAGHVLLFLARRRTRPDVWVLPGGGVEPGESPEQAALRELAEETGLRPHTLGSPVVCLWERYPTREATYECREHVFVLRVPSPRIDTSGFTEKEQTMLTTHRWWAPADLASSGEPCFPAGLPQVVSLASGVNLR
jgi:8-oxo-dGTP pyrophosphatase MutT (NUDIX family)